MNTMGHDVKNFIGVQQRDLVRAVKKLPDSMPMGSSGMAEIGAMEMPMPDNTLPMMTGLGQFGPMEMGGMFTVMKVREGLGAADYADPGWYKHRQGTVALEVVEPSASAPRRRDDAASTRPKVRRRALKPANGARKEPSLTNDHPTTEWSNSSMIRSLLPSCILVALTLAGAPAAAGPGAAGHDHHMTGFSAGEPGNPKKPARVVQITMQEGNGKMLFVSDRVEVRKGEQIRFVLLNHGELDHEFVLATHEENLKHAEQMKKNPEMEHDDPNAKRVAPKKRDAFVWRFTKRGVFEFACLIPGHREAGMFGTVVVK